MRRETTNFIRFVLEDLLPPVVRDSRAFLFLAKRVWGEHIENLADFRERSAMLTEEEYRDLYVAHPRIHQQTDNSESCVAEIANNIAGSTVCDVGCGTGYLLHRVAAKNPGLTRVTGVDFVIDPASQHEGIEFVEARVETLPFEDNTFDTVICTHVLEHLLEPREALAELRRVTAKRLIIVTPKEREYKYTFNPHFNFFPYKGSLLRVMVPLPQRFRCDLIGRDWYYQEEMDG